MNNVAATVIAWIACGLLVIGMVVGLMPITAMGEGCGSAFFSNVNPFIGDAASCSDTLSILRVPAVAFCVTGVVGLAAGLIARANAT